MYANKQLTKMSQIVITMDANNLFSTHKYNQTQHNLFKCKTKKFSIKIRCQSSKFDVNQKLIVSTSKYANSAQKSSKCVSNLN